MPVLNNRAQQLKDLRGLLLVEMLLEDKGHSLSSSSSSSSSSSFSDFSSSSFDSDEEMLEEGDAGKLSELYSFVSSVRYFEDRGKFVKSREFADNIFNQLPDSYFRHVTRMEKKTLWLLVDLIKVHPVFQNNCPRSQFLVSLQLAATLDRLGHYGNGVALKRSGILWGIATGSIVKFMDRCMKALELELRFLMKWPDHTERARISSEFAKKGFCKCVGLVDGTALPLTRRPKYDGEVYFDRKKRYSLNMQVVCDDQMKIIHMSTGFPGTCSDIVCIRASPLWQFKDDPQTFSEGEYLLADSGYSGLSHIVCAFKRSIATKDKDKVDFNYCVAKTRVKNEHYIGILKSRWHSLKEIKTQLKGLRTARWIIRQIECCVRLYNFANKVNAKWNEVDEDLSDGDDEIDVAESISENNNEGSILQTCVIQECLQVNRQPGGFL